MSLGIFDHATCAPFAFLGLTGTFWEVNTDIIIGTWVAMAVITIISLIGRWSLTREGRLISSGYEKTIGFFMHLTTESFGIFNYKYFAFITSLFLFTFMCCLVGLIPHVEEATRDLNTTLALSLTSFLYIQREKIKTHGVGGFLKEFIHPFVVMAPIHIVGELSKIASMAFRLFGNILGGGVILSMILDLVGSQQIIFYSVLAVVVIMALCSRAFRVLQQNHIFQTIYSVITSMLFIITWLQLFLGVFEGLIQSFVLTMLTTTYLSMAIAPTDEHNEEHSPC